MHLYRIHQTKSQEYGAVNTHTHTSTATQLKRNKREKAHMCKKYYLDPKTIEKQDNNETERRHNLFVLFRSTF